jgi:hypothetical protein
VGLRLAVLRQLAEDERGLAVRLYLLKGTFLVLVALVGLQGLSLVCRSLVALRDRPEDPPEDTMRDPARDPAGGTA